MVSPATIPRSAKPSSQMALVPIHDVGTEAVLAVSIETPEAAGAPSASITQLAEDGLLERVLGGPNLPRAAKIAVRATSDEVARDDFPRWVVGAVERWALAPNALELHLNASAELTRDVIRRIDVLRTLGFNLVLADFGASDRSLQWLRDVAFETVELGPSHVGLLGRSPRDKLMFTTLVDLAHRLGASVGIDGVATAAALEFARTVGVERARGRYFAAG